MSQLIVLPTGAVGNTKSAIAVGVDPPGQYFLLRIVYEIDVHLCEVGWNIVQKSLVEVSGINLHDTPSIQRVLQCFFHMNY